VRPTRAGVTIDNYPGLRKGICWASACWEERRKRLSRNAAAGGARNIPTRPKRALPISNAIKIVAAWSCRWWPITWGRITFDSMICRATKNRRTAPRSLEGFQEDDANDGNGTKDGADDRDSPREPGHNPQHQRKTHPHHAEPRPYHDGRQEHQHELPADIGRKDSIELSSRAHDRPARRRRKKSEKLFLEHREFHQEIESQNRNQQNLDDMRGPLGGSAHHMPEHADQHSPGLIDGIIQRPLEGRREECVQ
jgi:hypothetical protein